MNPTHPRLLAAIRDACPDKEHSQYRHGFSKSRIYGIWNGMLTRCYNPKSKSYWRYGKKGIKVCKSWRDDFMNFFKDMGDGYFDGATIDRIDNSKGYCAENCRWLTASEQSRNRRVVKLYEFGGKILPSEECDKIMGFAKGTIRARIKKYKWSVERALTEPKRGCRT